MSTLATREDPTPLAARVFFSKEHKLGVVLTDGREVLAPLSWFPRLAKASAKDRKNWRLIGGGVGIHWPKLDEDVSVASLLGLPTD
jgi:hypothetical protein